ncbi:MAG: hypothetical protein KatS3mg054_0432 [Chloroflexus sp.]|nr:MAG: hypothetical protein KatS3mg054_0432 [Chloroflexus sp.]
MYVLNFGHPMTETQVNAIKNHCGVEDVEVKTVKVQVDMDAPLAPQIAALVDTIGFTAEEWQNKSIVVNLPGLSTAAAVLIAELHGRMGYFPPVVRLKQEGTVILLRKGTIMIILNFGHPITDEQASEQLRGHGWRRRRRRQRTVKVQVDMDAPLAPQIAALVDTIGFTAEEWQNKSIVVNLPGLSTAAAVLIVELHGRMGYFPPVVRLKQEGTPPRFVVAEVINLAEVRNTARRKR